MNANSQCQPQVFHLLMPLCTPVNKSTHLLMLGHPNFILYFPKTKRSQQLPLSPTLPCLAENMCLLLEVAEDPTS